MSRIENPYLVCSIAANTATEINSYNPNNVLSKYQVAFSTDAFNGRMNKKTPQAIRQQQRAQNRKNARNNRGEQKISLGSPEFANNNYVINSCDSSFDDLIKNPDFSKITDQRACFKLDSDYNGSNVSVHVRGQTVSHPVFWHCPLTETSFGLYYRNNSDALIRLNSSDQKQMQNLEWA